MGKTKTKTKEDLLKEVKELKAECKSLRAENIELRLDLQREQKQYERLRNIYSDAINNPSKVRTPIGEVTADEIGVQKLSSAYRNKERELKNLKKIADQIVGIASELKEETMIK